MPLDDEFDQYIKITDDTAVYPEASVMDWSGGMAHPHAILYLALKLNGEAGEVAELIGKEFRKAGMLADYTDPELRVRIKLELGDIMWYIARFCKELNLSMDAILEANVIKLKDRKAKGEIKDHA